MTTDGGRHRAIFALLTKPF